MGYVPDYLVARGVKETMQDDGKFDDAQVGCKVTAPADALDRIHKKLADFARELVEFRIGQRAEVLGGVDSVEQSGQRGLLPFKTVSHSRAPFAVR
jgi:hypothetical protein